MKRKLLKASIIAVASILLIGTVAYAAIATPDTYLINQVNVYRHILETNDQGYLVVFNLDYTGANPDEDAGEAWLVRLLDVGDVELEAVAPFVYADNNEGYDEGAVWIYFSAADAPAWGANYTMELAGNPTLTWAAGDPPAIAFGSPFTWSSSVGISNTRTELTSRVRFLATSFETSWGGNLIEILAGEGKLTVSGDTYFSSTIPSLRTICPDLFSTAIIVPEFEERAFTQAQAITVETRWVGDPLLDLTGLGNIFGISRMWATSILWVILSIGVVFFVAKKVVSGRLIAFLFGFLLVMGAVVGLMPFMIAPIVGSLGLLGVIYTMAWSGAQ